MYVSEQLRKKNIAEYLLYMWQVEDIIRANGLDLEKLKSSYISHFKLDEQQEKQLTGWYENLITMMRDEGVAEKGHLQINKNIILMLSDLHNQMLHSSKHPFYNAAYYKALPYIVELRAKNSNKDDSAEPKSEIETCFDALYGLMLLHLQKKEVSKDTQDAMADISKMLGMLSEFYKQDKAGTLDL